MNGNSPPTLHKQFNTVHFIQVYIVRNNLYALFFSLWLLHPPIAFISQYQMLFKKKASRRKFSFIFPIDMIFHAENFASIKFLPYISKQQRKLAISTCHRNWHRLFS